jgi:hypothetical protein
MTIKQSVSETGPVSFFRWGEGDSYSVGILEGTNLKHWTRLGKVAFCNYLQFRTTEKAQKNSDSENMGCSAASPPYTLCGPHDSCQVQMPRQFNTRGCSGRNNINIPIPAHWLNIVLDHTVAAVLICHSSRAVTPSDRKKRISSLFCCGVFTSHAPVLPPCGQTRPYAVQWRLVYFLSEIAVFGTNTTCGITRPHATVWLSRICTASADSYAV